MIDNVHYQKLFANCEVIWVAPTLLELWDWSASDSPVIGLLSTCWLKANCWVSWADLTGLSVCADSLVSEDPLNWVVANCWTNWFAINRLGASNGLESECPPYEVVSFWGEVVLKAWLGSTRITALLIMIRKAKERNIFKVAILNLYTHNLNQVEFKAKKERIDVEDA